jgi:hypothetical protein
MKRFSAALLFLGCLACVPGGVVREGGYADQVMLIPAATRTRGAKYRVVCRDEEETKRRDALIKRRDLEIRTAQEAGQTPPPPLDFSGENPPFRLVAPETYRGECDETGEHSAFYLFHFSRVTPPIDPERAIGTAVQRLEGDTMIGIRAWHETHYYSILGVARVFKVRGTVIKFDAPAEEPPTPPAPAPGGRR